MTPRATTTSTTTFTRRHSTKPRKRGLASRSSRLAFRCVLLGGLASCSSRPASRCCRVGSPLAPRGPPPAVFCWVGLPLVPQGSPPAVFCWVGCLSAGWFSPLVLEHALEYALLTCPLRDPEILRLSTVGRLIQLVLGISFLSRLLLFRSLNTAIGGLLPVRTPRSQIVSLPVRVGSLSRCLTATSAQGLI